MIRYVLMFLVIVATSLYFFPFGLKALPGPNTKMMLAAMGLVVYLMQLGRQRGGTVNRDMFFLSLIAASVSLMGFFSITYNNTPDYAYATYLVSMWVWIGGAYMVTQLMKWAHGKTSVKLVCNYLIAVCVTQCALALFIDMRTFLAVQAEIARAYDTTLLAPACKVQERLSRSTMLKVRALPDSELPPLGKSP